MPDKPSSSPADKNSWPGVIRAFGDYIPLTADNIVTLNEGNTPLIRAERLAEYIAPKKNLNLYLKYEGLNPTGSFKDRGMTTAVTHAVAEGATTIICASTGNTAASAAAYAARAGLRCIVLVPEGKIALGKLAASLAYGAEVITIEGSFDKGLALVREIVERNPIALVNSVNPWRLEGQKTAAFEICDQLGGKAPDWLCLPYGKGLPRILGAQASGAAPIVSGKVVKNPETVATAIRIGNPARWRDALQALDESGGNVTAVTDEQILEAWKLLARLEGIFVEPASASGLAALIQQIEAGLLEQANQCVVIVLTGHGLKDPDIASALAPKPQSFPAEIGAIESYLARYPR
jgi:threonine synthase